MTHLHKHLLVDQEGGCFVTKIDLFFQAKDENLPVRVEIREVINGYPALEFYLLVEKY